MLNFYGFKIWHWEDYEINEFWSFNVFGGYGSSSVNFESPSIILLAAPEKKEQEFQNS